MFVYIKPGNAWVVAAKPPGVPVLGAVNRGAARVSRVLPTLDLWPYYRTEEYELEAGFEARSPQDPDFHGAYRPVGQAPEVEYLPRKIQTSLISRMFGFLRPLM